MFIEPKENESYKEYISRILNSRENKKDEAAYQELHHITPRCMGGKDDDENLIYLYPEEHYYAHKLLALENPDNKSLAFAWFAMHLPKGSKRSSIEISPEEFAEMKKRMIAAKIGVKQSEEHIKKRADAMKGHVTTEETRKKIGEKNRGRVISAEGRKKMSDAKRGKPSPKKGIKMSPELIEKNRLSHIGVGCKKVYCPELDMTFDSIKDAALKTNQHRGGIEMALAGKRKTSGKHPETKVSLHWLYA